MRRIKSFEHAVALYLVATPIGNLSECSPRMLDTLKFVDVIACEDTRTSSKLLSHFHIQKKVIAYHNFNEQESSQGILKLLKEGKNVALISDAGYPLLCDPGVCLVQTIIENHFPVIPISGSNAALNALVASGIAVHPYYFFGFLNSNANERKKQLEKHKALDCTLIYYESPHRILKTLKDMYEILGDRNICVARELTKKHEEFIRGKISELLQLEELKGELVVVVEKSQEEDIDMNHILMHLNQLIDSGESKSSAVKKIAKQFNVSKNELYALIHK